MKREATLIELSSLSGASAPEALGSWQRVVAHGAQLGHELAGLFTQPAQRTYWVWLLCALGIAGLVSAWQGHCTRDKGPSLRARAGVVWSRWSSASSRVDAALLVFKPVALTLLAAPWAMTTAGVAMWISTMFEAPTSGSAVLVLSSTQVTLLYTGVLFVAWDLSRFALHWAMHRFDALWQLHQVHHSAEVLTPLTLHRVHPIESALYRLRGVLVTGLITGVFFGLFRERAVAWELLGVNAIGLACNAIGGNLRHSHVRWGWGRKIEGWLISPAQHQLHHSARSPGPQVNFGTWLSIWDRALGSLVWSDDARPDRFGLAPEDCNHDPSAWTSALIEPLMAAVQALRPASLAPRTLRGRLAGIAGVAGVLAALGMANSRDAKAQSPAAPSPDPEAGEGPQLAQPHNEFAPVDLQPGPEREPDPPTSGPAGPAADTNTDSDLDLSDFDEGEDDPDSDLDLSDLDDEEGGDAQAGPEGDVANPAEGPATNADAAADPDAPEGDMPELGDYDVKTETVSIIGDAEKIPRVAGSAHRLDNKTLERLEIDDVHSLLQLVPGVYVRGEDGFGLRPNIGLRGVDSNRSSKITLMEDGVLLGPAPYAAPAAYYFPMTTRMVGLEVFKGPASIRHGPNTIGGAVNMQTRGVPTKRTGGIDIGAGLRGYGKAHGYWGRSWRYGGILVEGLRLQSNGFKHIDGGGETGFGKNEIMVKGRVHTNPANRFFHQIDLKLGGSTERSYETYLGLSPADFDADPFRRYAASQKGLMKWWRAQGEATYMVAKGDIFEFSATAYRHDFSRSWRKFNAFRGGPDIREVLAGGGGQAAIYLAILRGEEDSADPDQVLLIGTNDRRYVSQGLQTRTHFRPMTKYVDQDIEFGARLHHDTIRRDHDEEGYLMLSSTLVPEGGDTQNTTLNRGSALAGAFHLLDEISIVDAVTVTPGARVELIRTSFSNDLRDEQSSAFNAVFIPGLGAHVQIIDQLGVFAGVHSGFSPVAPGQPDAVEPERSINYELGLRARHRGFTAEATGFYNDYANLTGECTFAQGCDDTNIGAQFNAGEVQVAGSELSAAHVHRFGSGRHRPAGWLQTSANYTFTWSRFETAFDSASPQFGRVEAGDALPYVPLHTASAQVAGGTKRFSLNASLRFTGEMRDTPGQGDIVEAERIDRYLTLDAGGRVWVTRRASIYATAANITGSRYVVSQRPFGLRPGRPFFASLGFKYDFS